MYKIHGLDTVNRLVRSAGNNKFYDTLEEAEIAAKGCVMQQSNECDGIVIFKAIEVVRREHPPVVMRSWEEHRRRECSHG